MMTGFIASINDCFKACNDHSNENTVSNPMCTKKAPKNGALVQLILSLIQTCWPLAQFSSDW